jgi:uncharacterized protein (DUF2062 family)
MFYFAYWLGIKLLNQPTLKNDFEFSIDYVITGFEEIGPPFLLGCLVLGTILSVVGYFSTQWIWRYSVTKRWKARKR